MRKQPYYTDPARKELAVFQDFRGGLNTTTSQDNMADTELTDVLNMSYDERGAVARRTGLSIDKDAPAQDIENAQLYFRFHKNAYSYVEIIAADGKLYVDGVDKGISFQKERIIEAVQWYGKAYIATGSGLYEYDGDTGDVKKVEPYKPNPLEALYVGTNAIAPNPNEYLSDGEGSTVQLTGVTFSSRYGIMNQNFTLTAYHIKPTEATLQYRFEYRYPFEADGVYHIGQDWGTSKTWTFKAEGEGDMQFRISARRTGQDLAEATYLVPKYTIKPAADPNDIEPELDGIHTCNRIMLHWERLIIYGDTKNVNTIYISHLKNANYFPMPNTLHFETTRTEPITSIVRFRDFLIAFTDTSIQALFGKSPSEYRRVVLNTSIGCIAYRGACVMDNYVTFLSADGIYYLKSVGYVEDKANVAKLDANIANIIPKDARDAVAVINHDQVQFIFPSTKQRFRFYKLMNAWTKDQSPALDITHSVMYDNKLYHLKKNGVLLFEDTDSYSDAGYVYEAIFETRYLDFGLPYHPKKLKELQVLAKSDVEGQVADVKVMIDGAVRTNDIIDWKAKFVTVQEYNTFIDKLRISGKCLRMRMRLTHTLDEYLQLIGYAVIHKLKKP